MVAHYMSPAFVERFLTGYFDTLSEAFRFGPGIFNPFAPANPAVKAAEEMHADVLRSATAGINDANDANLAIQDAIDETVKRFCISWFVGGFDHAKMLSEFAEAGKSSPFLVPTHVDDHHALRE